MLRRLRLLFATLLVASPLAAQDPPDMASLPTLRAPGTLSPIQMAHQAAWLQVDQTGLYRLTLNGPGKLGLTRFRTADGRSDGSDPQERLMQEGSAYTPAVLEDLLLQQGQAYFLQEAAMTPRALTLTLIETLPPPTRLPPDWDLTPGTVLVQPDATQKLTLTASTPMRLMVITPPGSDSRATLDGDLIGPGGSFPLLTAKAALHLEGDGGPMLLRVGDAAAADDTEPGDASLGTLPPQGRELQGTLLAKSDRDAFDLTLTHDTLADLSLLLEDQGEARLTLFRRSKGDLQLLLRTEALNGTALRRALTLPKGDYRIEVTGDRDHPTGYRISLHPSTAPATGEPDDQPALAQDLRPGTALRGTLGPDDPGYVAFTVPRPGHLWELRGVQGVSDLALRDGNDLDVGTWAATAGALVLRLSLPVGRYTGLLRGEGPYAIRLTDLGPTAAGLEIEPNEAEAAAMQLRPGSGFTGDFQAARDVDLYEIILPAATPLLLKLTAPDDGAMQAEMVLDGLPALRADVSPAAPLTYSASFPAGRSLLRLRAREDGPSGRYGLTLTRSDWAEEDEPQGLAALPGDGRIAGRVGGFDAQDRIFVALPPGSGQIALTCTGADWSAVSYGDDAVLTRQRPGDVALIDFADLGGALELRVWGGALPADYACRAVFAPTVPALPSTAQDEALDDTTPTLAQASQRVTGQFLTQDDVDRLTLPDGGLIGLRCDTPARAASGDHLAQALKQVFADGIHVVPPEGAVLELTPRDAALPQDWACEVLADTAFATPAQMGPPAAFTGRAAADKGAAVETGFAPALLLPATPDWLRPVQIRNDLDLGMYVKGLDIPFRAFSRMGQTADLTLTLHNPGAARQVTLDLTALADGWRLTPASATLDLAAGAGASLPVTLNLPPMQSPASDPQLRVVAISDGHRAALTQAVTVVATADDRAPQRFWAAPPALRGGMDALRFALGGRLLTLDGQPAQPEDWAFLHDGDAPQSALPSLFQARQAVFQLAEPAPVAGLVVQLRSAEDRGSWPDRLTLDLSVDGQNWQAAAMVSLTASDLPQIFALPAPMQAGFARLTRAGCRADPTCGGVALADIGLIAAPDWHPTQRLDLADPALGGHVVTAQQLGGKNPDESPFDGKWNDGLLTGGSPTTLQPANPARGDRVEAIIAFAGNRAARIAAVDWVAGPDNGPRLPMARLQASLTGPAGPWIDLPALAAPAAGQTDATLTLPAPLWARALKLTFARDARATLALPDRIRVWEDRSAPSILGLWEPDSPVAGYETLENVPEPATLPKGGPDAAHAVALSFGQTVTSSVQLERNTDHWRLTLPPGPLQMLTLRFVGAARPEFMASLTGPNGAVPLTRSTDVADLILTAVAAPGSYTVQIAEPPRSVAILWDTSDSVGPYVPRILEAVRLWATSLKPGRDRIQLLPFGVDAPLLPDWAGSAAEVDPVLAALPQTNSSDVEAAMGIAAEALSKVDGQRGIVVITDAETAQAANVWGPMLRASPRVVALSIDSSDPRGVTIMQDWAGLNGGYFARVSGAAGLADGLDLAAALFRAPKAYTLTVSQEALREPDGQAQLTLLAPKAKAKPTGGIEVILDASGSMLKRMAGGQRRIEVAHDALAGLVRDTLPRGTPFAFRAFGLAPDDCASELKLPFGPLNPAKAEKAIRAVPAVNLAKTAIAASLAAAAADLVRVDPPRVMVLVTDGDETCDGDVAAEIARIRAQGLDIRLSIIGFAVDDAGLAKTFADWTTMGGGAYVAAGDAAALTQAMRDATEPRFAADRMYLDGRVEQVATLSLGVATTLPAGRYRLRPLQTATGQPLDLTLTDAQSLTLKYTAKSGLQPE